MKKMIRSMILFTTLLIFNLVNAQSEKVSKTHGVFSSLDMGIGVIGNLGNLNSEIKTQYLDYKALKPVQAGFRIGAGYFYKRVSLKADVGFYGGANVRKDNQYSELTSYNLGTTLSYAFLRHSFFDIEASVGCASEFNKFLHTRNNAGIQTFIPLSSNNVIIPVGLTWWVYPSETPSIDNGAIGIFVTYNILVSKGKTYYTGLNTTANYPNVANNSLWFGISFRI